MKARARIQLSDLGKCERLHEAASIGRSIDVWVVHDDRHTVPRDSNVEFDRIGTEIDSLLERFDRVLGRMRAVSAMRDDHTGEGIEKPVDETHGGAADALSARKRYSSSTPT